jgi:hypothetical protein
MIQIGKDSFLNSHRSQRKEQGQIHWQEVDRIVPWLMAEKLPLAVERDMCRGTGEAGVWE